MKDEWKVCGTCRRYARRRLTCASEKSVHYMKYAAERDTCAAWESLSVYEEMVRRNEEWENLKLG